MKSGRGQDAASSRRRRQTLATWVARHKTALRGAGLVAAAVTLVAWNRPTPWVVLWIAVALLVVNAAIELLGRAPHRAPAA